MIDRQVPTGEKIYSSLFGLFNRVRSCDKRVLRNALSPSDLELDPTNVPYWEYHELVGFVKMLEDLIPLHIQSVKTEIRLRLIGYCHIMEADFPFAVMWNLLRIMEAQEPSWTFVVQDDKGKKIICEYPTQKITAIANLASQLNEPLGDCLTRLWVSGVRNAFSHSQYTLMVNYREHSGYMMRTKGLSPISRKSPDEIQNGKGNPSFDDIRTLYQGALALLNCFDAKYNEACKTFSISNREFNRIGDPQDG